MSLTLDVGRLVADIGAGPGAADQAGVPAAARAGRACRAVRHRRAQLLASVWGYDFDPGSNVVDVCVRRLRSKLGFDLIKTVRGEGYQLADGL